MKASVYIIKYEVRSKDGDTLKSGTIKVKNKIDSIHAQTSLEDYLSRKVSGFDKLIVRSCKEDSIGSVFGDIFGTDNPFGF